jgi:hypothetical protein
LSPPDRSPTTLADTAATEPPTAKTSNFDPPNIAYITNASGAAYKPISNGTPATEAIPIDSGINSAATLTAAIRSAGPVVPLDPHADREPALQCARRGWDATGNVRGGVLGAHRHSCSHRDTAVALIY